MVRVIYRWRVAPQNFEAFQESWRTTTNHIHKTVPGALGSFMLKGFEDECDVLTIAKWDCLESWKTFYGNQNPEQMTAMRTLGQRVSVEAFEEIEDHTR